MDFNRKILLVAVNAKYIHTCPAVYSLMAYAAAGGGELPGIEGAEYTINDRYQDILADIVGKKAGIIAFSVYIWNTELVHRLIRDIRKILADRVVLWAGGPEATYDPESFLGDNGVDLCMLGEGEETFSALTRLCQESARLTVSVIQTSGIRGIAFMKQNRLVLTGMADPVQMDSLPWLYADASRFDHRIVYYESSRGCPFACAYCLSGRERGMRYRSLDVVLKELGSFLEQRVPQVKFVDRTFNADISRAMAIWEFIRDHDNGVTNFHFEIEADRMNKEALELLAGLRPGLVQMEIGVQSANPMTLRSVHRNTDLSGVAALMKALTPIQNINLHLDLIAGLPYEDLDSFARSFCTVYDLQPHQLQLGFLKLLRGTGLYERREEYGLICSDTAPYEVLCTRWLSFGELSLLHRVSDRVEEFYNSQGFRRSLPVAVSLFPDAFSFFTALADYYRDKGYEESRPSVRQRYEIFTAFVLDALKSRGDISGAMKRDLPEIIRLDEALHVHPSRRMHAGITLDLAAGPVCLQIDYTHCSPVNKEARLVEQKNKKQLLYP